MGNFPAFKLEMGLNGISIKMNENAVSTSTSGGSFVQAGSEKISIKNNVIDIASNNSNLVKINGNYCVPCTELADLMKTVNDEKFRGIYTKYCSKT